MKNIANYLKKTALLGSFLLAGSFYNNFQNSTASEIIQKEKKPKENLEYVLNLEREIILKKMSKEESSENLPINYFKLIPDYCSEYAKKSSKKTFGKEYEPGHAWDLRYKNKIADQLNGSETLTDLAVKGVLHQGMLIGVKRNLTEKELKKYGNKGKDMKGNEIKYTHVIEYKGINKNLELEFDHQYGRTIERLTEKQLAKKGLTPIEVITVKDNL